MSTYEICINLLLIITLVLAISNEVELAKVAYTQHEAVKKFKEDLEDIEKEFVEDDETGERRVEVRLHRTIEIDDKEEKENRKQYGNRGKNSYRSKHNSKNK